MTGPKHLWSGDWERESARPPAPAIQPAFESGAAEPDLAAQGQAATRWWRRRQALLALGGGVAVAAVVALVLTLTGPGARGKLAGSAPARSAPAPASGTAAPSSPAGGGHASTRQQPTATPVITGPTANWLGMQIVTSPQGVVISTVALGSPADRAGLEPGDAIEELNGHQMDTIDQLAAAAARIARGKPVRLQVLRDSVMVQAAAVPMTERPTIHP